MLPLGPITLRYTEGLIRRAIWAFWWRSTGFRFFGAFFTVLAWFVYLVASGDRSWWVGVMGSFLGLEAIVTVILYAIHFRSSIGRFRRMKSKEATLEIDDDQFRLSSDIGSAELLWSAIIKVWKFPEFWLIFYSAAQFSILPLADLNPAAQAAILEKVKTHGAKVT